MKTRGDTRAINEVKLVNMLVRGIEKMSFVGVLASHLPCLERLEPGPSHNLMKNNMAALSSYNYQLRLPMTVEDCDRRC